MKAKKNKQFANPMTHPRSKINVSDLSLFDTSIPVSEEVLHLLVCCFEDLLI
jgi:hypothetical protein